jgi:glycosyltransferase involved in cell wall biosynthesis
MSSQESRYRVLFVVGNLVKFDVTPIHIFHRLESLQSALWEPRIVALLDQRSFFSSKSKTLIRQRFQMIGVNVRFLPRLVPLAVLLTAIVVLCRRYKIIHAIGYNAMLVGTMAALLTRRKLVFESHGVVPEEMVLSGAWSANDLRYRVLKMMERRFIQRCDHMIVVSEAYKVWVHQSYGKEEVSVAPCAVARSAMVPLDARPLARRRIGVDGRFVVAFDGSFFAPWGNPREYVEFFALARSIIAEAVLLVLTTARSAEVESFLDKCDLSRRDYVVLNLAHEEVPLNLVAADVGLLLRRDSIVNRVASPMKFSEYMSCGVPVVVSLNVGDVSNFVESRGLGMIYEADNLQVQAKLRNLVAEMKHDDGRIIRVRCRQFASEHLSYESQDIIYRSIYSALNGLR